MRQVLLSEKTAKLSRKGLVSMMRQYLATPERGCRQVLFCCTPWRAFSGAALVGPSVFGTSAMIQCSTSTASATANNHQQRQTTTRLVLLAALACFIAGCGSNGRPQAPSSETSPSNETTKDLKTAETPINEDQAVRLIEQLGGMYKRDDTMGGKPITSVSLWSRQVTDTGLKELAGLKQLRDLDIGETKVSDLGLKELAGLLQLRTLKLNATKVTDVGLNELTGLMNLYKLRLDKTHVTDTGLKELASLKNLRDLNLSDTRVTGTGFKELASP